MPDTTARLSRAKSISLSLLHSFHMLLTATREEDSLQEWKSHGEAAIYPPNCSVSLLSSLFKSLSVLRTSSIFSTECSTVV